MANQFYAQPAEDSAPYFKNPDGFSGAPVFSLAYTDEQWHYHIIGVQSAWYESSGTLAVCPFTSFARAIEEALTEARDSLTSTTGIFPVLMVIWAAGSARLLPFPESLQHIPKAR